MATLMNPPPVLHTQNLSSVSTPPQSKATMSIDDSNYDDPTDYIYDTNSDDYVVIADQPDPGTSDPTDLEHENPGRRILPNKMSNNLHSAWKALAPTLVEVFLKYSARTHGHPLPEACLVISACAKSLFKHSCDAIHVLASALKTHYACRGFQMTRGDGQIIQEPFRRSLGQAVQWFDILQVEVECQTEAAAWRPQLPDNSGISMPTSSNTTLVKGRCSSILMQHCPACFAGMLFERPLSKGGDIHIATDGNFHHRHQWSVGDCPCFYNPAYFLPKAQVDEVRHCIQSLHKCAPKKHTLAVPDEVIDQCKYSYEAADGKKQKAAMDSFDDTGRATKYAVALLEHLFSLVPQEANVIALYDVGCVLSWSLSHYDILPSSVTLCLQFATTAMHAYGHEWACQLEYNPQMCIGLGLSDSKGTERLWSRFVKLIGIQHSSSRQRRLLLIDRQAAAIGKEMQVDLGDWIKRRLKRGVNNQGSAVKEALRKCGITTEDLQAQWADQKKSQLSIRAHAPAQLKKELDMVLALQADIDASDRDLQATHSVVEKGSVSEETLDAITSLERSHECLMTKVEVLYLSLNVHDRFPELQDVDLDFVQTLLMARDLKINIWKRAIGSFFEWDKLDRAVGGANQALSMKLHQQTRKAIAKRQPALMTAIRKFNSYCEHLESLYDPSWSIPLPTPLPTKLADLQNDQTLMEDVWITPSVGDVPRWMEDSDFGDELAALELALRLPTSNANLTRLNIHVHNSAMVRSYPSPKEDIVEESVPHTFEEGPEQVALSDVLQDSTISDEDDKDDDKDKCMGEPEYVITWQLPEDISQTCMRPAQDSFPHQVFESRDVSMLAQPTAQLNDTCINGVAALLYSEISITSHKDLWLLPIHRPSPVGHWVFCAVYMLTKKLHLFDSLADRQPWKNEVKDIMKLIAWLLSIAQDHRGSDLIDIKGWVARPLVVQPLQTNGYDCGLWVLAVIAADNMIAFRHYIRTLVLRIPVS
ncbi:hypothetical protein BD769DRAFT_1629375 [Suillus cothurnatus]|nr:hypothetical protein BD769DRAFT_1629375 [Suillus cothurnatus]